MDFGTFPEKKFVVKPNRGSQGKGIYVVKDTKWTKATFHEKKSKKFSRMPAIIQKWSDTIQYKYHDYFYSHLPFFPYSYKVGKKHIPDLQFKKELVQILDGQYRIGNKPDSILIEELIEAGDWFEMFCEWGLADIRIICFNLVPIAAMLRVPTKKSWGKANIAQGWIALGVDIATWSVTSLSWKWAGKVFTDEFPEEYKHFKDVKIPYWEDLLLLSANTQFFVNIGYIGLDWVITKKWPQLLEVNGRAWIEIQNITMTPLLKRIKKVDDLHVPDPKKWVEITHALFSKHKIPVQHTRVVYLSQKASLSKAEDKSFHVDVIALATIKKKRNYVSKELFAKLGTDRITLKLPDSDIKATITIHESDSIYGNQIRLWTSFLEDYVLKTEHKAHPNIEFIGRTNLVPTEIQDLKILDQNIFTLNKKISLAKVLKPTNYLSELDTFVSKKGKYNPTFHYSYPSTTKIASWRNKLQRLYDQHAQGTLLESPFAKLLYNKIDELDHTVSLIEAYAKQDFKSIYTHNKALFNDFDPDLIALAKRKLREYVLPEKNHMGKKMTPTETKKRLLAFMKERSIEGVPVYATTRSMSRIAVGYKHDKPFIRLLMTNRGSFWEAKLESKLVHEIDVHLKRYLNGQKMGWNIMTMGTAKYIIDEEGLAIWKAEQIMKNYLPDYNTIAIYEKYDSLFKAKTLNFMQLAEYIMKHKKGKNKKHTLSGVYNTALKLKRGIQQTKHIHQWAIYMKDKVYLDGYAKISNHIQKNNGVVDERLMVGKITLEDIDLIY